MHSNKGLPGKQGPDTASPELLAELDRRLEDLQHELGAICHSLGVAVDDHATALESAGEDSMLLPEWPETPAKPGKE
jgi:hypothetical protein